MDFLDKKEPSFQTRLRLIREQLQAASRSSTRSPPPIDDWEPRLAYLNGELHENGSERISTYQVFDYLGLRRSDRTSGAARRVARVMRRLGWRATRFAPVRGSFQ